MKNNNSADTRAAEGRVCLALPAALALWSCAASGDGAPPAIAAIAPGPQIAEVLVTARKRKEASQNVPVSLSLRTGDQLEHSMAHRLQEVVQTMPNVSAEILNPRQTSITMRGLGRNPANDGLESSVGVFVDGVYLGRPGMAVIDFVDLERLEVLRGPQGVMFGKNTTAGLLSFTTRAPTESFEAHTQAALGNQDYMQVQGAVSGPLFNSEWSGRLTALISRRDGFVDNSQRGTDQGEFNRNAARAQLAWRPDADFNLRLIGDYSDQQEDSPGAVLVNPGTELADGSIRTNNFLDRTARAGYSPTFNPTARINEGDALQRSTGEQGGASAHLQWQLADHTLTSITAWRMWNFRPRSDFDFTPLDIQRQLHFEVSQEQLSTELRFASPSQERVAYQLGVFLWGQNLRSTFVAAYGEDAADFAQPGLPSRALEGFEVQTIGEPRTRSAAAFGHLNWRIADRTTLSAGMRWTVEEKEALIQRTSSGGAALMPTDVAAQTLRTRLGAPATAEPELDEDFTSGLLTLSQQIGASTTAYLSAARGAKSGGLNIAIVPAGVDQVLDPEIATSFEAGVKQRWPNASLDLSIFNMDIEGYHATVREPLRGAGFLANAGEVRTRGAELEAAYRPIPALQLSLTAGYADAEFTSFPAADCPPETVGRTTCDVTGSRVPGAPPWTVNVGAAYSVAAGRDLEAYIAADWLHAAAYRIELSSYTQMDDYDVVNARIGARQRESRWETWLWVRNALDEDYYTTLSVGGSFNSGMTFGLLGDPRTYGVTVRLSF